MVTVTSRFRVRNGLEQEVRRAFLNRPRLIEKAAGFCGLNVMTDSANPSVFLLVTRWTDELSFQTWHRSEAHHQSHAMMPPGLKLDATFTSLTIANTIEDPAGIQTLNDALEGQTAALSQWLMKSESVLALLLAPDGSIRARNKAAYRIFAPGPANNFGTCIWDYLVCSDAADLRQRLSEPSAGQDDHLLLNLIKGQQDPITIEVGLVRCGGAVLLLGSQERRHDTQFETEILKLTNELSLMMRESTRANRELKQANEIIEQLAHTDPLTGLANRRTLDEILLREISRARRLHEDLSLIMADLDHFKSFNDQYGHITGDQVLLRSAAVFKTRLRPYDVAARYGGEEFILVLPATATDAALTIAERIRKDIEDLEIPECPRPVTASLGVATWMDGELPEAFVARADAALYKAKSAGRNRVEAAPESQT